jgi:hypothetical protein
MALLQQIMGNDVITFMQHCTTQIMFCCPAPIRVTESIMHKTNFFRTACNANSPHHTIVSTVWRWPVGFTPWPLYTWGKWPMVPTEHWAEWGSQLEWKICCGEKSLPCQGWDTIPWSFSLCPIQYADYTHKDVKDILKHCHRVLWGSQCSDLIF